MFRFYLSFRANSQKRASSKVARTRERSERARVYPLASQSEPSIKAILSEAKQSIQAIPSKARQSFPPFRGARGVRN